MSDDTINSNDKAIFLLSDAISGSENYNKIKEANIVNDNKIEINH